MPECVEEAGVAVAAGESLDIALRRVARAFSAGGIATAVLDARLLLMAACGMSRAELIARAQQTLTLAQAARFADFAKRRLLGEPVSRIIGVREFWGLEFSLSPGTLDPRPDTETLVQAVIDKTGAQTDKPLRILDLGTGTGCILVALLREMPLAHGIGTDLRHAALVTAAENARRNGVAARAGFVQADWLCGIRDAFDIVVANPPYIETDEIAGLSVEVRGFDPLAALDGGPDGLAAYRGILQGLDDVLKPGGLLAFEVGHQQAGAVCELVLQSGLAADSRRICDLAWFHRVVTARRRFVGNRTKKQLESEANRDSL